MNEITPDMQEAIQPRFESYEIQDLIVRDGAVELLGKTAEGKVREFFLVVHRDRVTNTLQLDVGRHFISGEGQGTWPDVSDPWQPSEMPPYDD